MIRAREQWFRDVITPKMRFNRSASDFEILGDQLTICLESFKKRLAQLFMRCLAGDLLARSVRDIEDIDGFFPESGDLRRDDFDVQP